MFPLPCPFLHYSTQPEETNFSFAELAFRSIAFRTPGEIGNGVDHAMYAVCDPHQLTQHVEVSISVIAPSRQMVRKKKHKCHLVDTESESEDLKDFVGSSSSHCSIPLFLSFSLFFPLRLAPLNS